MLCQRLWHFVTKFRRAYRHQGMINTSKSCRQKNLTKSVSIKSLLVKTGYFNDSDFQRIRPVTNNIQITGKQYTVQIPLGNIETLGKTKLAIFFGSRH